MYAGKRNFMTVPRCAKCNSILFRGTLHFVRFDSGRGVCDSCGHPFVVANIRLYFLFSISVYLYFLLSAYLCFRYNSFVPGLLFLVVTCCVWIVLRLNRRIVS